MTTNEQIANIIAGTYELLTENIEVYEEVSMEIDNIILKNALREIEIILASEEK